MLNIVKLALRITTTAFDSEITRLINECIEELTGLGVIVSSDDETGVPTSEQVQGAIIAYCKWQFGSNDDSEKWREIFDRKLAQLKTMTGFTTSWEE